MAPLPTYGAANIVVLSTSCMEKSFFRPKKVYPVETIRWGIRQVKGVPERNVGGNPHGAACLFGLKLSERKGGG